jgi:hypothetical protein
MAVLVAAVEGSHGATNEVSALVLVGAVEGNHQDSTWCLVLSASGCLTAADSVSGTFCSARPGGTKKGTSFLRLFALQAGSRAAACKPHGLVRFRHGAVLSEPCMSRMVEVKVTDVHSRICIINTRSVHMPQDLHGD